MDKNTTVEIREGVSLNVRGLTALQVAAKINEFCESYGPIARHMWNLVYQDPSTIKLSRTYTKELTDGGS